jgi:prophage regulatory protein
MEGGMTKFLLRGDLKARGIKFSNVHLIRLERAGAFPRRVRLGGVTVAWLADEIEQWQAARIAAREAASSAE